MVTTEKKALKYVDSLFPLIDTEDTEIIKLVVSRLREQVKDYSFQHELNKGIEGIEELTQANQPDYQTIKQRLALVRGQIYTGLITKN